MAARQRANAGGTEALARTTVLPASLRAFTADAEVREDVAIGQLWRLRWYEQDVTELAVILDIDRWWISVAPVTTDVGAADEYSVLIRRAATPLDIDVAICVSLECAVPMFLLDRLAAPAGRPTLDTEQAAAQLPPPDTIRGVRRAWRRGSTPPADLEYGVPLEDGDLDRRELRSTIASSFAVLLGASAVIPSEHSGEALPLRQRLRATGLAPREMIQRAGVTQEMIQRIGRDGRVTVSEAQAIADLLDVDVQTILQSNPPLNHELILEVSRPRYRRDLRRIAVAEGTSEDIERWAAADRVAPLAARTTSSQTGEQALQGQWAAKVELYLKNRLADLPREPGARP